MAKKAAKNPKAKPQTWSVYLLECRNGKLYTGISTDVAARFKRHVSGKGAKFTRANAPSHFIGIKKCKNRSVASKLEYAIKQLKPKQKRELAESWK